MYKLVLVITAAAARAECVVKKQTHAFYYLWYGTPATDGKWLHWDHAVLPHWTKKVRAQYKHLENYTHEPPTRLHAPFYPAAGPYSSSDRQLLDAFRSCATPASARCSRGRAGRAAPSRTRKASARTRLCRAIAAAKRAGIGAAMRGTVRRRGAGRRAEPRAPRHARPLPPPAGRAAATSDFHSCIVRRVSHAGKGRAASSATATTRPRDAHDVVVIATLLNRDGGPRRRRLLRRLLLVLRHGRLHLRPARPLEAAPPGRGGRTSGSHRPPDLATMTRAFARGTASRRATAKRRLLPTDLGAAIESGADLLDHVLEQEAGRGHADRAGARTSRQ